MADTSSPAAAAPHGGRRRPTIALTFDDGPHPESTPRLLAVLRSAGHRATFFVCGQQAERYPELLLALHRAGMWIGNHSYSHPHLTELPPAALAEEIARTQRIVRELTGTAPTLFRPPYLETGPAVRAAAANAGLTEVLCTTDTRDWAGATPQAITDAAAAADPGGIVLMHDGYSATVSALPAVLRAWSARGVAPGPAGGP
ncbi:polysaccharide deacetylase family protein [Streptomyces tateyamensis]|uniref:Polysaccharide deacetylase family protein n=1 Tax=Streptomyces tateyamensis TaxID=565073 RepID=A0A2V4NNR7_9ACTN|nr:polysaccharide deacetylase family protein [Streptomyces tateyamensis]PYC88383.1 polysaccharide deacetylase family protein [Streptomyces tateyamensis]